MKQVRILVELSDNAPDDVAEVASAIYDAVGFAENDGMWPHKWYVIDSR